MSPRGQVPFQSEPWPQSGSHRVPSRVSVYVMQVLGPLKCGSAAHGCTVSHFPNTRSTKRLNFQSHAKTITRSTVRLSSVYPYFKNPKTVLENYALDLDLNPVSYPQNSQHSNPLDAKPYFGIGELSFELSQALAER